jgi:hypothetical protein
MKKVLIANVISNVNNDGNKSIEFELTELNQYLAEGWIIEKYDIVTNQIAYNFSIVYQLVK